MSKTRKLVNRSAAITTAVVILLGLGFRSSGQTRPPSSYVVETRGPYNYQKVLVNAFDGPSLDAFGRWRVSEPQTLFDSKLIGVDDAPLFWDEQLESGGGITASTPTAAKPYIDFTSTDVTAGVFTRQTRIRPHYQPGKSQKFLATAVLELASGTLTGVERRVGMFDDNNGFFFESDAGVMGVTLRSNDTGTPADTTFVQTAWNLDNMDGDGDKLNPSGITLDETKAQIYVVDYQWLAIGRVRFGIEIGGILTYVHQFSQGNASTIPWTSTPNLPVRYQMVTTGSSGVASMRVICSAVISEGGQDPLGVTTQVSTAGASVTTAVEDTLYAVVGIRLKSTHLGTAVRVIDVGVQIHTAAEFIEWCLMWNPTVADTFAYSGVTNSSLERALGATANTITGGYVMAGGYAETGGGNAGGGTSTKTLETSLMLGSLIDGTQDEIVLAVRAIGGVSAVTLEGAISVRESL